jgi:hypothetical protein
MPMKHFRIGLATLMVMANAYAVVAFALQSPFNVWVPLLLLGVSLFVLRQELRGSDLFRPALPVVLFVTVLAFAASGM